MPFAYFGDRSGVETRKIADDCMRINRHVDLTIDHTFLSTDDTLRFLAGNDINVFLYHSSNQGLSSALDYALSVKRPIAITNDSMFKHIYLPQIDVGNRSLLEIKNSGTEHLKDFYDKWNPDNFHLEMDSIFNE